MIPKRYLVMAVVLVLGLLLVPSPQLAQNSALDSGKVTPNLRAQLGQAAPDELVTVIVRMTATPNLKAVQGRRSAVFSALRATAAQSQAPLVAQLHRPEFATKVGVIHQFWIDNLVLVQATPDVVDRIARRGDVSEVFDNYTFTLPPMPKSDIPRGTDSAQQTPTPFWDALGHIGVRQVWQTYGLNGSGVRVGGLDTGVDITHPDLAGKMYTNDPTDPTYPGGWAEFDSNGNMVSGSVPHDSAQHGTHTTGTMIGGNASGYDIGCAPGAMLMHGLVIPGGSGSFAQVVGGMEWIVDPDGNPMTDDGADLVNMSLGATGTFPEMIPPTDNMAAAGVFPSFAIGNSGPSTSSTGSPGNVPSAFGVGATDSMDVIASFSGRGPVTWSTPPYVGTYIKPDISAPGVLIFSSVPGGGWEGDWDGTSMATPHVSGTVALMLQANPSMTVDQIKQLLAQTAVDLGSVGKDNTYGYGEINAFAAVSAALAGIGHVEGTVYSSAGGTVAGAQVLVTDTGQRVFADADGHYSIAMVAGDHNLAFSSFGYDPTTIAVTVVADETITQDVTLNQLPSGYIAGTVTDIGTGEPLAATVKIRYMGGIVRTTTTDPGTGAYSVALPVGSYDVIVEPPFPYPRTTQLGVAVTEGATTPLDFQLSPAQVLIVDDDAGSSYESYFEAAVAGAGRSYLVVSTPPTAEEMATFDAVVWFTGNDYNSTLFPGDEAALAAYLDGGGRLFITGQDIGFDIHTDPFYADYLHATYVQDDVALGALNGNPASPIGVGLSFAIQGGSGANNQGYPSEIDPISPAMPVFFYDPSVPGSAVAANSVVKNGVIGADGITSSGAGAVSFDNGTYKLVYFAFGFEAIADEAMRTNVMDRVLDWLQGYPKIVHTPLGDTEDTSSAYEVSAIITSDYFPLDPATFAVVYDAGAGDVTLPMSATGNADEYHAFIPAQPADTDVSYYITAADIDGHTSTHPLGAPAVRHDFRVGPDDEFPVVDHTPYTDTNDLHGPYRIAAMATDNLGIESVYLVYRRNGDLMHRVRMEMANGNYVAYIPGPSEVGDVYEYAIMAMDESYSGLVTRFPASGFLSFTIVEEFVWDFETDDGGFMENGGVWEWGSPTSGPGAAHSGVNVWATVLGGSYPNSMDATLDVPQITLAADKPYALFSFWHWYNFETNYDGGNVKVSTDGGNTFEVITPVGGYDGTARTSNAGIPGEPCFTGHDGVWEQETFDLSAYAGQAIVLRFHAGSDGSVYYPGWYVDDVRLRSTDSDDIPPVISDVEVPASTYDASGPYTVTAHIGDLLSGLDTVSLFYSTDGGTMWTDLAMSPTGNPDEYSADIPGQPGGTRIQLYLRATDTASNETLDPPGAPASTYEFAILPSADILVMVSSTTGASLDDFRDALEANGHQADYWNLSSQGSEVLSHLNGYRIVVLDERGSMTSAEQSAYAGFLSAGSLGAKKGFFALGRDLSFYSSTRPFIQQYFRADYVQDDPGYRELTGEPSDPIGIGETFVISGSYPDEVQRSTIYPGGEVVYHFTGEAASLTHDELAGAYEKDNKEWDGVLPQSPKSLDAAAGMKYDAAAYRSVYFTFNFDYIQEPTRRAAIIDRVVHWIHSPEIAHTPLTDTEDTLSAYVVTAQVYSDDLDPSRVKLTYDVGSGDVTQIMLPTGNPDEYAGSIPAQSFGTTVSYYISAANLDGNTSHDPPGAPTDRHAFQVTSDITPPVIVHNPPTYSADLGGPYVIEATVTDNVAVDPTTVKLYWRKNGGVLTSVTMTNTSGNEYSASIPGPSVVGDTYEYYMLARDTAAVPNTGRSPATGFHTLTIVDFYAWDFESNDGSFSAGGPDWEWGTATSGPDAAHSGVNLWATKLGANYSSSSNSTLDTPPVIVPSSRPYAMLSMWQWYHMETNYDGGNVKISADGGATWAILTPDIGYNGTARTSNAGIPGEPCFTGTHEAWVPVTFDLTAYRGQSVIIRFHFGSDSSVQYPGWYIDDVRIESIDDTEGPVFTAQDIPTGTLDTVGPYTVTTEVRDALSGVASVALHYSTDGGSTWNTVAMSPTGNPDEYSGDIPGQPSGTRIKLYMEAADNASNATLDPAGAPGSTYEFGILPSGDYLVLLGGSYETDPIDYQTAFATLGRSYDIWNWDTLGMPTVAFLESYQAVVIDESWYFDTTQRDTLSAWLDRDDGTMQRVFMLGRDLSYGSLARPFMEQYTGAAYEQDNPGWYQLTSAPGDPIGAGETFVISGSYPDELKFSTTWPGAQAVYKYSGTGSSSEVFGSPQEAREFYQKYNKEWSDKLWPFAPSGPDSLAAVRFVGPHHATVYFAFNLYYIQEPARRAAILGRALDWLNVAAVSLAANRSSAVITPDIPDELVLRQNYPNPFNPTTRITIGVPAGETAKVSLKVYNVRGQLVTTIFEGTRGPGYHTFMWDGVNDRGVPVSSGVYFARFQSNRTVLTRKMVMLK